jgi:hypothetical protein
MLRLILAVLFRAGEIEITYQGNRFHSYQDPLARTPFINNVAFRSTLFSPRQSLGLKLLTQAVQQLEEITGEEVDVEEGAIAGAFKQVAGKELERLYPLKALAEAQQLPIAPRLAEYQQTLLGIQASAADDCVRLLLETGPDFQETRERVRRWQEALNDQAIALLRQARLACEQVWPKLAIHHPSAAIGASVDQLQNLLVSDQLVESLATLSTHTRTVLDAYKATYLERFDRRAEAYRKAIEEIKNRSEWESLWQTKQTGAEALLAPLQVRLGCPEDRVAVAEGTALGNAGLTEMESDLVAVGALKSSALIKLQELAIDVKEAPVRRVRIAEVFNRPIQSQADLEAVLQQLRDSLQKLIDEGTAIILE